MIDLSKAKKGDIVEIGGKFEIEKIYMGPLNGDGLSLTLKFKEFDNAVMYWEEGNFYFTGSHPFDIKSLTPAKDEFEEIRERAKPVMRYLSSFDEAVILVGDMLKLLEKQMEIR